MLKVHKSIVKHLGFGAISLALHLFKLRTSRPQKLTELCWGDYLLDFLRTFTNVGVKKNAATPIQISEDQTELLKPSCITTITYMTGKHVPKQIVRSTSKSTLSEGAGGLFQV
jgi:hypothetical protein